jgi:hypothetical protein
MVHESVTARLTKHVGATQFEERGTARGTFGCAASVRITLHYTSAYLQFDCAMRGDEISGSGTTSYYASGKTAYFHGTLTVSGGKGRYRHSDGSRLTFTGSMRRGSYALRGEVAGELFQ